MTVKHLQCADKFVVNTRVATCAICGCHYLAAGGSNFCFKCRSVFGNSDKCRRLYESLQGVPENKRKEMLQELYAKRARKMRVSWLPESVFDAPISDQRALADIPEKEREYIGNSMEHPERFRRYSTWTGHVYSAKKIEKKPGRKRKITSVEQLEHSLKSGRQSIPCKCCGKDFIKGNRNSTYCNVCSSVFTKGEIKIISKLKPEEKAKAYRARLSGVSDTVRYLLPVGLFDKWADDETDIRQMPIGTAVAVQRRRDIRRAMMAAAKANPKIYTYTCPVCGKQEKFTEKWNTEEVGPYCCTSCRKFIDRKPYKGKVKGLQDMPIEKIASLPSYARAMYEQHMGVRDKEKLRKLLIERNKGKRTFSESMINE